MERGGGRRPFQRASAHTNIKQRCVLCSPRPSLFALAAPSRRFQRATRGRDVELGGVRGHWLSPLKDALLAAAAAAPAAAKKVAGQQNFLRRERPRLPLRGLRAPLAARLARRAASAPSAAAAAAATTAAAAALAPLRSGHHCAFVTQKRCARREGRSRLAPRGRRENCVPFSFRRGGCAARPRVGSSAARQGARAALNALNHVKTRVLFYVTSLCALPPRGKGGLRSAARDERGGCGSALRAKARRNQGTHHVGMNGSIDSKKRQQQKTKYRPEKRQQPLCMTPMSTRRSGDSTTVAADAPEALTGGECEGPTMER